MKINKFLAFTAIVLMAIGAMGFVSSRVHAQSGIEAAPSAQATEAPGDEKTAGPDTDTVQEQTSDNNQTDSAEDAANEAAEMSNSEGQDALPAGTPGISSDAALTAAQDYLKTTTVGTPTLDDENGTLVYSVELNGSDVKVDAMNGSVLGVDQAETGQTGGNQ